MNKAGRIISKVAGICLIVLGILAFILDVINVFGAILEVAKGGSISEQQAISLGLAVYGIGLSLVLMILCIVFGSKSSKALKKGISAKATIGGTIAMVIFMILVRYSGWVAIVLWLSIVAYFVGGLFQMIKKAE